MRVWQSPEPCVHCTKHSLRICSCVYCMVIMAEQYEYIHRVCRRGRIGCINVSAITSACGGRFACCRSCSCRVAMQGTATATRYLAEIHSYGVKLGAAPGAACPGLGMWTSGRASRAASPAGPPLAACPQQPCSTRGDIRLVEGWASVMTHIPPPTGFLQMLCAMQFRRPRAAATCNNTLPASGDCHRTGCARQNPVA